ncbi:hypothetical protein WJX74_002928 [Apatococcus lobatus]|uniref:Thioredoxin domain-containing protein n=1 Tax=Apatococcus lobatus TaxID=904363 RepID=A0AAW1S0C0_9CHLO
MPRLSKIRSADFYRKLPSDLTEASLAGAVISICVSAAILLLFGLELNSYLTTEPKSSMVVDRSGSGELLRINFNVSFSALSCEFATLDVSDALGTKKINLTKTVRKLPINEDGERAGHYIHDDRQLDIKYDHPADQQNNTEDWTEPLTHDNFKATTEKYSIVVANFYAPWCPWCQRLEPTWEAVTEQVHSKYPEAEGRIRFAKINCVAEQNLCRENQIMGFPSIRVFRKGRDEITIHGMKDHESYRGDRTTQALLDFADSLVPSAGQPHYYVRGVTRFAKTPGCALSGFVLVKKVPGTLHFLAKSPGHSFDHETINMTHTVNYMYFGNKPSPRRRKELEHLHPMGLTDDWADKMAGQDFLARNAKSTFEHYLQVVLTTIMPLKRPKDNKFDAYEYTAQSHTFSGEGIPAAKFSYTMSPIQIIVTEQKKAFYHFVTTTCAIIGGVFTVAGILDGLLYRGVSLAKKVELGKQG